METTIPDDRTGYAGRHRTKVGRPSPAGTHAPEVRASDHQASAAPPSDNDSRIQRMANIAIATMGLLLTWPLLVAIAVAIKLTSPGPVFYRQARIGMDRRASRRKANVDDSYDKKRVRDLGGAPFRIYKFRTMQVDAERESGAVWAQESDPRVTAVGRVLRQFRLDELPQLFNVIRGDMNIVGPRPERPAIFADMRGKIENYSVRQRARPGITGLAQINQAYDSSVDDVRKKVEYDLEYIARKGIAEDLRIMIKTIPVVLFRRGGW
jgi:lipopolysaccharide/colanic/teichoic acid biosynthesis glycosyltransferase